MPLEDFIGRLVDKRDELKNNAKMEKNPLKKKEANALQNSLKFIINAFYGTLASPYFMHGNTILAYTL